MSAAGIERVLGCSVTSSLFDVYCCCSLFDDVTDVAESTLVLLETRRSRLKPKPAAWAALEFDWLLLLLVAYDMSDERADWLLLMTECFDLTEAAATGGMYGWRCCDCTVVVVVVVVDDAMTTSGLSSAAAAASHDRSLLLSVLTLSADALSTDWPRLSR